MRRNVLITCVLLAIVVIAAAVVALTSKRPEWTTDRKVSRLLAAARAAQIGYRLLYEGNPGVMPRHVIVGGAEIRRKRQHFPFPDLAFQNQGLSVAQLRAIRSIGEVRRRNSTNRRGEKWLIAGSRDYVTERYRGAEFRTLLCVRP